MEYIIFDFGGVLAYPTTGNWHLTPKFLKLIDQEKLDKEKAKENIKRYKGLIDCALPIKTLEEEYQAMVDFYDKVLSDSYDGYEKKISEEIARDRVYGFDKYQLFPDVIQELEKLSKTYKLILLSDNWPSVIEYMRSFGIEQYFDKIYVSSICETKKKNGTFFDVMLKDYNITDTNAVFIDDHEENLDVAKSKGITGILIDRSNKVTESKYDIINSISEINEEKIKSRRNKK